jgi:hypothetical protein
MDEPILLPVHDPEIEVRRNETNLIANPVCND